MKLEVVIMIKLDYDPTATRYCVSRFYSIKRLGRKVNMVSEG